MENSFLNEFELILKYLANSILPLITSGERSTAGTKDTCVISSCAMQKVWGRALGSLDW